MPDNHKVFILGLKPGADVSGLCQYLSDSLGIKDTFQQKQILYNTPSIVCEIESSEEANGIRERLETFGARIKVKSPQTVEEIKTKLYPVKRVSISSYFSFSRGLRFIGLVILIAVVFLTTFYYSGIRTRFEPERNSAISVKKKAEADSDASQTKVTFSHPSVLPTASSIAKEIGPAAEAYKEIEKQNYGAAWKLLQNHLAENPHDSAAIKGLKYTAFKLAEQTYINRNIPASIQYIESGLQYAIDDPELTAQLGSIYYSNNDFEKARNYLEDALRFGSTDPDVHLLLAKIFYFHDDNIALSQAHLQKALETEPWRKDIRDFLGKINKERSVEDNFQAAKSQHFVVKYQGVEDQDAAYTVLYILEKAWSDIGYDLGEYPPDPVVVILYTDQQFGEVTQAPHWAAGLFDGRIRLPVGGLPDKNDNDLRRLLYHEYTHVVVFRITKGRCPVWLNEGLAQYMQIRAGATPDPWLRPSILRDGRGVPSLKALSAPFLDLNPQDAIRAYIASYFAVNYLVDEYGLTDTGRLLQKIGEVASFDAALMEVLGTSSDDFEKRFLQYLKTKSD